MGIVDNFSSQGVRLAPACALPKCNVCTMKYLKSLLLLDTSQVHK